MSQIPEIGRRRVTRHVCISTSSAEYFQIINRTLTFLRITDRNIKTVGHSVSVKIYSKKMQQCSHTIDLSLNQQDTMQIRVKKPSK